MKNIIEILSKFPKGIKLFSSIQGDVRFIKIESGKIICRSISTGKDMAYDQFGRAILDGIVTVGQILAPDEKGQKRDCERNWSYLHPSHCTKFNEGDLIVPVGDEFPTPLQILKLSDFGYTCKPGNIQVLYADEDMWKRFHFVRGSDIVFKEEPGVAHRIIELDERDKYRYVVSSSNKTFDMRKGGIRHWNIRDTRPGDILVCHEEDGSCSGGGVFYTVFKEFDEDGNVLGLGKIERYSTFGFPNTMENNVTLYRSDKHWFEPGYQEDKRKFNKALQLAGIRLDMDSMKLINVPKFDIKSLKPFDKVLVRKYRSPQPNSAAECTWSAELFSHYIQSRYDGYKFHCVSKNDEYGCCIPFNDETKHLTGTQGEPSDYYINWLGT